MRLFYNVIKSGRLAWKGAGGRGGNSREMKAAGWEAAGDPHPARAAPLLWSGGPQGSAWLLSLPADKEAPLNESKF